MKNSKSLLNVPLLWQSGFIIFLFSICILSCQIDEEPVELVFVHNEDPTLTILPLVRKFNQLNSGKIHVTWKKIPGTTDDLYKEVKNDFESGSNQYDVIASDLIWTATLASNKWIEDVSSRYYDTYDPQDFIAASLKSSSFHHKIWGVPWYTDAGMLFYRKDLLQDSDIPGPASTWDQLIDQSKIVMRKTGVENGFVFQGGEYEGGVTNACEFIWNAGGSIMIGDLYTDVSDFEYIDSDPSLIVVNSAESIDGFSSLAKLINSGIVPANIQDFNGRDGLDLFRSGEALYYRGWPSMYGGFFSPGSKITPDQIGVAPLPVSKEGLDSYSCLGGWNLVINAQSDEKKKKAAWNFIKYMTDTEQQKFRASEGGVLPSLRSLYEDVELVKKQNVIALAIQVISNTRERPVSPYYMDISPKIANVYYQLVKKEITPEEAINLLDFELNQFFESNRTVASKL